jgi:DNA-directed RNA polymerase subunit RPC12/RpoP
MITVTATYRCDACGREVEEDIDEFNRPVERLPDDWEEDDEGELLCPECLAKPREDDEP